MRKIIISTIMIMGLVFFMLPQTAEAAAPSSVSVGGVSLLSGGGVTYWVNDGAGSITATGADANNYNIKYDPNNDKPIIHFKNLSVSLDSGRAMVINHSSGSGHPVKIILEGNNTLATSQSAREGIYGVRAELTIEAQGAATLAVNSSGGKGISVNSLIVEGGTITVTGGDADIYSFGIMYSGQFSVNGGNVTAIVNAAGTTGESRGIGHAAAGGAGAARINGGTVIAKTESVTGTRSAFKMAPVLGPGVEVFAASPNADGSEPVAYNAGSIGSYMYLEIRTELAPEATPSAAVDYSAEKLSDLVSGAVYLVGATELTADGEGKLEIADAWFGTTIALRTKGNGTTTGNSEPQSIALAARPAVPACTSTQPTATVATGSISGITTGMECSTDGGLNWTQGDGNALVDIAAGTTVTIRMKASPTAPKGATQSIVIVAFASEAAPSATVDYSAEKLSGLESGSIYIAGATELTADGEGKLAISDAWFGTTIALRKKGNGITTGNSEPQSIALAARPATPACFATQPTAAVATGSISGISTEMEYSTNGGAGWIAGNGATLTGLTPGTVWVRVKAVSGTAPTGLTQSLVITAYTSPASSGSGSGGGSSQSAAVPASRIDSGKDISHADLKQLAAKGETLTVKDQQGASLAFDAEALKGIAEQASGSVQASIQEVSQQYQRTHPGQVVYAFTVTSGGKTISQFGGSVAVTLPYTLKQGEDPARVTIWHLAADGTLTEIPCTYDKASGEITFEVSHFSLYMIGLKQEQVLPATSAVSVGGFEDVADDHWFSDAVEYVIEKGLMAGTETRRFSPNGETTRAMLVTILWRIEGKPGSAEAVDYLDVPADEYYAEAVAWASRNRIVAGLSADRFAPQEYITREQLAAVLYRYAQYKKRDTAPGGMVIEEYVDYSSVSDYAAQALSWAVNKKLLLGSENRLQPGGTATRAQVAAVLQRYIEN